jgi:hypothetical protein
MDNIFYRAFRWMDDRKNSPGEAEEEKPDYLYEKAQQKNEVKPGDDPNKIHLKDMIYDMKFTVPSFVQHNASEVLSKPKFLKAYIQGNEDEFLGSGNFQLSYMGELPGILWNFERSRELGDMVLFFPNPDYKEDPKAEYKENGIDFPTAMQYFFEIFSSYQEYPGKKTFMANLEKVFVDTFLQLDEFETADQKKKKERTKKNLAERAQTVKLDPASEAPGPTGLTTAAPVPELFLLKQPPRKKDTTSPTSGKNKKGGTVKENISSYADKFKHTGSEIGENNPVAGGFGQGNEPDEVDIEGEKKKHRKIYGGGMYSLSKGETLTEVLSTLLTEESQKGQDKKGKNDVHYSRVNPYTRDFLTLIRKCIFAVLANQGYVLRSFFLPKGDIIAVVANLIPNNLHALAKEIGMKKEVNFCMVDLMSLEPVDSELRPLRLHSSLRDEQIWESKYGKDLKGSEKEAVMNLREEINDLVHNRIDFKQVVRSIQGLWQENDADSLKIFDSDSKPVSIEVWKAYRVFLTGFAFRYEAITDLKNIIIAMIDKSHDQALLKIRNNTNRSKSDKVQLDKFVSFWIYDAFLRSIQDANLTSQEKKELATTLMKNKPSQEELDYFNKLVNPEEEGEDNRFQVNEKEKEIKRKKHLEDVTDHMNELRAKREMDRYLFFENKRKKGNQEKNLLMKNIWDDIGQKPHHYYLDYDNGNNRMRPGKRAFFQKLWVDETNPNTLLSERFNNMERLKLMNYSVISSLFSWIKP